MYRRKIAIAVKRSGKKDVWKKTYQQLLSSRKHLAEVNLFTIEKHAKEGQTIVVPGKVLSSGTLSKRVRVVALSASKTAQEKIAKAGGTFVPFEKFTDFDAKNILYLG